MRAAFFILIFSFCVNAQQIFLKGSVLDASSNEPLSFTNIRVDGTALGTASNKNGEYELKVSPGKYTLIASYIGYNSDTLSISVSQSISNLNFHLQQTNISLPEITITPGEDPAINIIRKAIKRKEERNEKLFSYEFEAYTKGILKTKEDVNLRDRSLSLGFGGSDSSDMKISAIVENRSNGYFKKPGEYKEIILARKQSANLPPTLNIFTGGRLIQNFYENRMRITTNSDIPGPLAEDALAYYDFYLRNISAINDNSVYKIYMTPADQSNPGFEGDIYIADKTFDLLKVDVSLNNAANVGGIFDTISIVQQFSIFDDSISMPIDYHLLVKINYLGLINFGYEINSILYDFKINPQIDDNKFSKAIITVLPDADKKDSLYWSEAQTIPNTGEEQTAYLRIDSLNNIEQSFGDRISILSSRNYLSDNLSISGPLSMYHFNRVEGQALDFNVNLEGLFDKRYYSGFHISHGFSDKKTKFHLDNEYLLGNYRTYKLSLNIFNENKILFSESDVYGKLFTTLLSLIAKDDFRDYYYSNGFNFQISGEVFPVLQLRAGFMNRTDYNAFKTTNVSLFHKDKSYRANPPIFETKVNAITAGFRLDFRDYIEDGISRLRTTLGKSYILLSGDITYSSAGLLNSGVSFTKYELAAYGSLNSFLSTSLNFRIHGLYNKGELPFQMMYALPGDINAVSKNYTFRTVDYNEITGDRVATLNLDYQFGNEIFRILKIPFLSKWNIQLNGLFNAAYSSISQEAGKILPVQVKTFNSPFFEAGFGLAHPLIPIKIEFSWKLNHFGDKNFRVNMNMILL